MRVDVPRHLQDFDSYCGPACALVVNRRMHEVVELARVSEAHVQIKKALKIRSFQKGGIPIF